MNVYIPEPSSSEPNALKFSSDEDFTLSAASPKWDGTLEYSVDGGVTWNTWDGSQLSGTATQPIYLRGTGNHKISDGSRDATWTFTGKYCTGNIENLLDYQTVANGQHPVMNSGCYSNMFFNCTSLTTAPELPAVTLAKGCYDCMFRSCTSLITAPALPATTLVDRCYTRMFMSCKSLTIIPELPATELVGGMAESGCYYEMFQYCNSLKLSETKTGEYQYEYRIPMAGTGTLVDSSAITRMFSYTGGTFTGTPEINTTYYTNNQPV